MQTTKSLHVLAVFAQLNLAFNLVTLRDIAHSWSMEKSCRFPEVSLLLQNSVIQQPRSFSTVIEILRDFTRTT